jgi:hypothetical protein
MLEEAAQISENTLLIQVGWFERCLMRHDVKFGLSWAFLTELNTASLLTSSATLSHVY